MPTGSTLHLVIAFLIVFFLTVPGFLAAQEIFDAVEKNDLGRIASLLEKNGDLAKSRDIYGMTPLHYAAMNGRLDAARLLCSAGADVDAATPAGLRPVHFAQWARQKDVAEYLGDRSGIGGPPRFPKLKGDYVGQKKPGFVPELFAPGIISTVFWQFGGPAFSPNGREIYWSEYYKDRPGNIFVMRLTGGRWSAPEPLPFSEAGVLDSKPVLSPDGRRLVFASGRPIRGIRPEKPSFVNLWTCLRSNAGWSAPSPFEAGINTDWDEDFPVIGPDGSLYFSSNRPGGPNTYNVYRCRPAAGGFAAPERQASPFDSPAGDAVCSFAPDGRYVLFMSLRPGGFGSIDIYAAFRRSDGSWGDPVNLGDKINSERDEQFAVLSPDGKFLFFTSNRNGNFDIYWVDARVIDALRPR